MSVMEMQKGAENTSNMQAGVDLTQALDKQEEPEEEKADQEDMAANALEEANAQLQATMFRVHAEHTMLQRVLGAVVGGLLIWGGVQYGIISAKTRATQAPVAAAVAEATANNTKASALELADITTHLASYEHRYTDDKGVLYEWKGSNHQLVWGKRVNWGDKNRREWEMYVLGKKGDWYRVTYNKYAKDRDWEVTPPEYLAPQEMLKVFLDNNEVALAQKYATSVVAL